MDEREIHFLRSVAKYMRGQQRPAVADRIEAICDGVKILGPAPKVLLPNDGCSELTCPSHGAENRRNGTEGAAKRLLAQVFEMADDMKRSPAANVRSWGLDLSNLIEGKPRG